MPLCNIIIIIFRPVVTCDKEGYERGNTSFVKNIKHLPVVKDEQPETRVVAHDDDVLVTVSVR